MDEATRALAEAAAILQQARSGQASRTNLLAVESQHRPPVLGRKVLGYMNIDGSYVSDSEDEAQQGQQKHEEFKGKEVHDLVEDSRETQDDEKEKKSHTAASSVTTTLSRPRGLVAKGEKVQPPKVTLAVSEGSEAQRRLLEELPPAFTRHMIAGPIPIFALTAMTRCLKSLGWRNEWVLYFFDHCPAQLYYFFTSDPALQLAEQGDSAAYDERLCLVADSCGLKVTRGGTHTVDEYEQGFASSVGNDRTLTAAAAKLERNERTQREMREAQETNAKVQPGETARPDTTTASLVKAMEALTAHMGMELANGRPVGQHVIETLSSLTNLIGNSVAVKSMARSKSRALEARDNQHRNALEEDNAEGDEETDGTLLDNEDSQSISESVALGRRISVVATRLDSFHAHCKSGKSTEMVIDYQAGAQEIWDDMVFAPVTGRLDKVLARLSTSASRKYFLREGIVPGCVEDLMHKNYDKFMEAWEDFTAGGVQTTLQDEVAEFIFASVASLAILRGSRVTKRDAPGPEVVIEAAVNAANLALVNQVGAVSLAQAAFKLDSKGRNALSRPIKSNAGAFRNAFRASAKKNPAGKGKQCSLCHSRTHLIHQCPSRHPGSFPIVRK